MIYESQCMIFVFRLEMDYELCSAQLRDMTEQRECSRGQAERLMGELNKRECALKAREVRNRIC